MADNYQITVTLSGRDNLSDELRQANTQLQRFEGNSRSANTASRQASGGFRGLNTAVGAVVASFGAMEIARQVTDLNNLGREVTAVRTTFEQLAGGPDAARQSLANLREMTGGVVDDLTLMQGANQLLLTGLATTNEQAAELVDLGFRLSAAMGVDAKEGIENLNAALLNNSYARLDTLGISAAAVRERVRELKEEGLDMSEAFAQAVLEEGREKIERLGVAAATAETSFNRLNTRFANMRQNVATFTSDLVETTAQLAELGFIAAEIGLGEVATLAGGGSMSDIERQQFATGLANTTMSGRMDRLGSSNLDVMAETPTMGLVNFALNDPDLFGRVSSGNVFSNRVFGSEGATTDATGMNFAGIDAVFQSLTGLDFSTLNFEEQVAFATELDTQLSLIAGSLEEVAAEEAALVQQQDLLNASTAMFEDNAQGFIDMQEQQALAAARAARAASEEQAIFESLNDSYSTLVTSAGEFAEIGGVAIMDPDEAAQIINTAASMETRFENLQQIAEDTDFEYISEAELAWAEEMTNQASNLADDAERAAAAFEAMSLTDLFGQTGGGRMGELSDMVLANIEDEEARAAVATQFDMASGRETEVSQAFQNEIAPLLAQITTQLGSDAGIEATNRALAALEEGRLAGLTGEELVNSIVTAIGITQTASGDLAAIPQEDPAMMMNMVNGMPVGVGGVTTTTTQSPTGDDFALSIGGFNRGMGGGEGAPGEEGGSPVDGMNEQLTVMQDQIIIVEEGLAAITAMDMSGVMDPFEHSFGVVQEATAVIRSELDSMAGTTYRTTLVVDVTVNDPNGFLAGNSPGFAGAMDTATSNNGGTPPGSTGPQ